MNLDEKSHAADRETLASGFFFEFGAIRDGIGFGHSGFVVMRQNDSGMRAVTRLGKTTRLAFNPPLQDPNRADGPFADTNTLASNGLGHAGRASQDNAVGAIHAGKLRKPTLWIECSSQNLWIECSSQNLKSRPSADFRACSQPAAAHFEPRMPRLQRRPPAS
jgi:hypothetical protein